MKKIIPARFVGRRGSKWYKVTDKNGKPIFGRDSYHLPRGSSTGKWSSVVGHLSMCRRGYHATQTPQTWYIGPAYKRRVFEVEVSGPAAPFGELVAAAFGGRHRQTSKKSLFRHMRLIREIKGEKLERLLHPRRYKKT